MRSSVRRRSAGLAAILQLVATGVLSKSQVNKAGKRLAKTRRGLLDGTLKALENFDAAELDRLTSDFAIVDEFRSHHAYPLRMTNANLRYYVREHGRPDVTQRLKKMPTIIDKLCREPTMQLANMEDIAGVRAVLPDQDAVDQVARKLRKNWKHIHRYRDYVRAPKPSGYRAIHIIAVKKGVHVEVQLRTSLQDVWANQVERDSRALRVNYKAGAGAEEVHNYYVAISELFAARESGLEPDDAFMQELVSRYTVAKPYITTGPPLS
jgi:putative GTP pyrophosphokinase